MKQYDLIIIGGGAAAFAATTFASENDATVAMINAGLPLGGTCANVGCVPTKYLLETVHRYYYGMHHPFGSFQLEGTIDFAAAIRQKNALIGELRKTNYSDILKLQPKTDFFAGYGSFIDAHTVEVNGANLRGDKILIATGASPLVPPIPGLADSPFLTHRSALELSQLPEHLLILGGGPIGMEFAQIFHHFGSKVTVIEIKPQILPGLEPLLTAELHSALEDEGIRFYTSTRVEAIRYSGDNFELVAQKKGVPVSLKGDQLLVATGLRANTERLHLSASGIQFHENGTIPVDDLYRTNIPHIFAAGDVIGPPYLETVAAKEGKLAGENALTGSTKTMNYHEVPAVVFTHPRLATVGVTESQYAKEHGVCMCRNIPLSIIPRARITAEKYGLIQLVVNHETDVIEGVHIVAPHADELIHEATLAVKFGLTLDEIVDTVHVFPTLSEGIKITAQAFNRNVFQMTCCIG